MEVVFEYDSKKAKIDISKINDWKNLNETIKNIFKIDENKEIEIYSSPKNSYLLENNFEEEFLNAKKEIKGIVIQDVIDLAEKIKNIGVPINKIEDAEEEQNDEEKAVVIKKEQIFEDKCSLCKKAFVANKYGCLFCPNYYLCNKCEENHPHPMIKYKSHNLSDNINKIIDVSFSQNYKEKDFHENLKKNYKLKKMYLLTLRTNISSNSFVMGNNQTRELNLIIKNLNSIKIPKNTLNIFIKNQYDLNIKINDEALFKDINAKFEIPVKLTIKSNTKSLLQNYNLRIEVISNNMDIIATPIDLKITMKNDEEDNSLNEQFNEFPSIILLPKEKKKKLQYIIKEKLSVKSPAEIKAIMEKFKWNIDEAISDLVI